MPHRLLLADDSVTIQRVIELTFAEEGVDVVSVGDGVQAIDGSGASGSTSCSPTSACRARTGSRSPRSSARDPSWPAWPWCCSPAPSTRSTRRVWPQVGAAAVLVKPFEPQMVIAKVRDLLSGKPAIGSPDGRRCAAGRAVCRHDLDAVCRRLLRSPRQGLCHAQHLARTPRQGQTAPRRIQAPRAIRKHLKRPKLPQAPEARRRTSTAWPGRYLRDPARRRAGRAARLGPASSAALWR